MSAPLHQSPAAAPQAETARSVGSRLGRYVPAAAVVASAAVVAVRDPNQVGSYGFCPLQRATGLDCPFCGGLRGTHDLLHGQVLSALDHNLLLPLYLVVIGYLVFAVAGGTNGRLSQWRLRHARALTWLLVGAVLVFFVVRNLPSFAYLDAGA